MSPSSSSRSSPVLSFRLTSGLTTTHGNAHCEGSRRFASAAVAIRNFSPAPAKPKLAASLGRSSGLTGDNLDTFTESGSPAAVIPSYMAAIPTIQIQQRMSPANSQRTSPNHALQRTRAAVTPAASSLPPSPPATQRSRQPRGSLSLGSLGVATR